MTKPEAALHWGSGLPRQSLRFSPLPDAPLHALDRKRLAPLLVVFVLSVLGLALPGVALSATVTVRSTTPGESVFMDGTPTGLKTPAVIRGVSKGRHLFEVRDGCLSGKADVQIPADGKVEVNIQSKANPGTLLVQPMPATATVKVDNEPFSGTTRPEPVACGSHSIAVTQPGFIPAFVNVDVPAGERVVLPVQLSPMGAGKVTFSASPTAATLVLDGSEVMAGTQEVPAGAHVITAAAPGRVAQERQFILQDGEELTIHFTLSPGAGAAAAAAPLPKRKAPKTKTPRTRSPNPWWNAPHTAGLGAAAAGIGLGVVSAVELGRMGAMGREYSERVDEVNAVGDFTVLGPAYANDYREDELLPQRNKAVGLTAASALLLAGGLTLTLAF